MVAGVMMTEGQLAELVDVARANDHLWEMIKCRELEIERNLSESARQGRQIDDPDVVLPAAEMPTLAMIAADLAKARYGADENYIHGFLILALRRAARESLGLSAL
ncbi:hypothetical protein [Pseudorhodoplanes sp.]|uniref:hypothetical protein n=1 Tax=Pseudorhodoplanes sp. TaxID=1934341 RepID=UPI002C144120|nr:hypothetical protein [Pseudorhodoplanes sp.]HWV51694.1 hypothetical protein [Pseudorhodoplanes sp.]